MISPKLITIQPLRGRISIIWLAMAATLVPLLAMGALLLWLSARSANRTSDALGIQVIDASTQRVEESVTRYLDRAVKVSDTLSSLIQDGTINATDLDHWHGRLFAHLRNNPEISSITFASGGRCVWLARYSDGLDYAISGTGSEAGKMQAFSATESGTIDYASRRVADYDVTTRPWYQLALHTDGPTWTPSYVWFSGQHRRRVGEKGVAYVHAIRGPDNALIGVLSIDVSLSQISTFLSRVAGPLQASMFITDESGELIGTSDRSPDDADDETEAAAKAFADGRVRKTIADNLRGDRAHIVRNTQSRQGTDIRSIGMGGKRYWARAIELAAAPNTRWYLTMAIPEDAILAGVRANARAITVVSLVCVLVSGLISAAFARILTRPFQRLASFADEIGKGGFDRRIDLGWIREVKQFATALNTMAANLEERVSLLSQKDAAEAGSALKARLIAHVSHEFRTPLNAIINYAELVRDAANAESRPREAADAANILTASKHLLKLIDNLLDLSTIEAGRLRLEVIDFSIAALLDDVAVTARPVVERNGNRLHMEAPAPDVQMTSDPGRLKQILINLLSNAGKFTDRGDVTCSATVDSEHGTIRFQVTDTGLGIRPDRLSRIFEPFAHVTPADQTLVGRSGAGLGLAISRQLCRALGGDIEIESIAGQGTRVVATLPRHFSGSPDILLDVDAGLPQPLSKHRRNASPAGDGT